MNKVKGFLLLILFVANLPSRIAAQKNIGNVRLVNVDSGWANNSVNTVVFRKNSLATCRDTQFIAYYDKNRYVVLSKRKSGSAKWILQRTPYQGNTNDAHNCISIMADGEGYLHLAWDHHNNRLHYAKSKSPFSLVMSDELSMTGMNENKVSYPEFYRLANGNLLFFYRDGGSGQGNLVINRYDVKTEKWTQLQSNLIDGEGKRNAYWQACTDSKGTIHVSWVWRESPDVSSNHDMCYARSTDGGVSWEKSTGEKYSLPINAATAEYVLHIPQSSELINQTSMFADADGHPYIATYWREANTAVPQYHIVYGTTNGWKANNLGFRKTPFTLGGSGTKKIPIARPQVIAWNNNRELSVALIFRDDERGGKISVALAKDISHPVWTCMDITKEPIGSWEPTYDTELWKEKGMMDIFVQYVEQVDGEGKAAVQPQMVKVLEWNPKKMYK